MTTIWSLYPQGLSNYNIKFLFLFKARAEEKQGLFQGLFKRK